MPVGNKKGYMAVGSPAGGKGRGTAVKTVKGKKKVAKKVVKGAASKVQPDAGKKMKGRMGGK